MLKNIAIAGAGTMGASFAQVCARYGYRVCLWGRAESSLEKGRGLIAVNQGVMRDKGLLSAAESEELQSRIKMTTSLEELARADLISENISEDLQTKLEFFQTLDPLLKAGAIVTTNTSGLSINAIAQAVSNKKNFAGMHMVNPPHLIPLVEIIRAEQTSAETAQSIRDFLLSIGKKPILVKKDVPGFALNRLQFAVLREALHLVESGVASPEDVDAVFKYGLGLRYACCGPFEVADLGGVDTFSAISGYLFADLNCAKEGSAFLSGLVREGRLGVKAGAGVYDYPGPKAEEAIKKRDAAFIAVTSALAGRDQD
ncbi:3-hydroxyacyl-CoA dehydrogenase family protein [Desulfovibrio sp. OttesenSCG-928-C14]|nr:3-hydroxyacyl-CoA dehydrogenase family protein [Desulfovibrio sp. OttesenSCG-928-C14]